MPRNSNRNPRKRPWKTALILTPVLIIGLWLPGRISVTSTPSLGYRVFFLVRPGLRFEKGDYLLFEKYLAEASTNFLLKMVGCGPGDRLTVEDRQYFCNQRFLGRALERDSKGRRLPQFIFNDIIPAGNLFMIGQHERSYDSRYFGFIKVASVLNKAYPLW